MENIDTIFAQVKNEEQKLIFNRFSADDAWKLGNLMVKKARKEHLALGIDIQLNGMQAFHYSFEGVAPYNALWIQRKENTVDLYRHSSLYLFCEMEKGIRSFEKMVISQEEYAAFGGGFPIRIKNVGIVGSVAVSGLFHLDDHNFVVQAIADFLGVELPA